MELETIPVKLSRTALSVLKDIARAEDQSVGFLIRDAVSRDLRRRQKAKTPVRADERLVAPLRALLADDFAYSGGWRELRDRLRQKGYDLQEAGGGLILIDARNGARMCKASELGYAYSKLLQRFDAPYPGHKHNWMLEQIRAEAVTPPTHQ